MNFLKKAGAIFMLVAIFASSCNKYADDFKQVNTKLDALATQVAGVTTLSADISSLKAQVTALQTAIAGMPTTASITALSTALTSTTSKIDAIATTLKTVTDAGVANAAAIKGVKDDLAKLVLDQATVNAAATKAFADQAAKLTTLDTKVSGIVAQITAIGVQETALAAAIATNNTAIAANATALVSLAAQQTALAAQLTALATATSSADAIAVATAATNAAAAATANAALAAQAAKIITDLAANTSADVATALVITGLQTSLDAQKITVDTILANQIIPVSAVAITGTAQVGSVLTASVTPAGAKATYQWLQAGTAIAGATSITYTVAAADLGKKISVVVTGTGNNLSAAITSAEVGSVTPSTPVTAVTLKVSTGVKVSTKLEVDATTPADATVTYQWQSSPTGIAGSWVDISGATSKTYTTVTGDATKYIRVTVTGITGFSGVVSSGPTNAVDYPTLITSLVPAPTASLSTSAPVVGTILSIKQKELALAASSSASSPYTLGSSVLATYQWQSSATVGGTYADIVGATGRTYTVPVSDLGKFFQVVITATGNGYYGTLTSSTTTTAVLYPTTIAGTVISSPKYNSDCSVTLTNGEATYQWQWSTTSTGPWTDVYGASTTSGKYKPVAGDVGKYLKAIATGTNGYFGVLEFVTSVPVQTADVVSAGYAWTASTNNVVITLTSGKFESTITNANFVFGGSNIGLISSGVFNRVSDQVVIVTGISIAGAVVSTDNTVRYLGAAYPTQTIQATAVTAVANTITPVTTQVITPALTNKKIEVTLAGGGKFKNSVVAGDVTISGFSAGDNAALAGGAFSLNTDKNVLTISISPATFTAVTAGTITLNPGAMAIQATTASGAAKD